MKTKKILLILAVVMLLSMCVFANDSILSIGLSFGSGAVSGDVSLSFENGFMVGYVSDDGSFMPVMFFGTNNVEVYAEDGCLTVADASKGSVLFTGSKGSSLAFSPITGDSPVPYTVYGGTKYPELIETSISDGTKITVKNIVNADTYIKGVLPSEVYTTWLPEALKAAAVATRTYTLQSISGKHSAYGVDLCATTCCQVYSGISRRADSTDLAVDETDGLVLTYGGKLITAVYHAISGGITESAAGAWGGNPESFPYLTVVKTPFENYSELSRGHWRHVLYDDDMKALIDSSSYKDVLSIPLISVTADDPTPGYLNNLTLTDANGASVTLKTSSQVRSFFGSKVLSANFTIGKIYMPFDGQGDSAKVLTASGEESLDGDDITILTANGKESVSAVKSAYFIDGKGHGHGVGLSQYGAQYAAKEGYTYQEILATYYPGTTIESYAELIGGESQQN